ncbi:negative regulator of flagellin synthesis FlgM [Legionella londiniensis]|uniref:Negative regulator of flagellin synthesis n=1 Tax=Legionella londiniensis TaxID=45068 RepID=A0A0W0VN56_9GAMM|nr:flagellin synthesis negative regulator [Legionella londiniensis]STX93382.1 negative regulator of flagellin synthesis FlgM [Legionella londiniensis]
MVSRKEQKNSSQHKQNQPDSTAVPKELLTSLNFEDSARQLDELKATIFNAPELNLNKIKFLKEEIANGRYRIQSDKIAEKLIEFQLVSQPEPA